MATHTVIAPTAVMLGAPNTGVVKVTYDVWIVPEDEPEQARRLAWKQEFDVPVSAETYADVEQLLARIGKRMSEMLRLAEMPRASEESATEQDTDNDREL